MGCGRVGTRLGATASPVAVARVNPNPTPEPPPAILATADGQDAGPWAPRQAGISCSGRSWALRRPTGGHARLNATPPVPRRLRIRWRPVQRNNPLTTLVIASSRITIDRNFISLMQCRQAKP